MNDNSASKSKWSDDPDDVPGPARTTVPRLAAPLDSNVVPLALGAGFIGAIAGFLVIRRVVEFLEARNG
ncbi:MAG: hypothetical protein R2770_09550 [Acidimicrobiales bacterium]|nr:hypothetical protein [Acidimicrobiales bacterium]